MQDCPLVLAAGLWKNFPEVAVFEVGFKRCLEFAPSENRMKWKKATAGTRNMKKGTEEGKEGRSEGVKK